MKQRFVWPLLAAMTVCSAYAQAQGTGTDRGAEVQRGVPGVDVDTNVNGRARSNGVPGADLSVGNPARNNGVRGVDVDTRTSGSARNNGVPGVDVDTRTSGAGRNNGVPGVDADLREFRTGVIGANGRTARADRN